MSSEVSHQTTINFRFFGPIMGIVGRSSDQVTFSKSELTMKEAILGLCEKYGKRFEEIALTNDGELNAGLIVFVNGQHVTNPSLKLAPNEGDEIQLMIASQMKGG
ncbi:MAG TPA: MoaD/ThiS family protein [Nitrososphaerales archaeon]|nr:MoaD/ThiS family protein [Nitrososphaerales archaeon]